ncbi:MAG: N-acetylglucosamine-6-phosphate deacetylase [Clostridiales bacterium]|nr:N-acetylglucosamine-6-phosphate deacetylase [Clostridiales bacterium]
MIKIKSDKIITEKGLFDGFVYIVDNKIYSVSKEDIDSQSFYDYTGKYVSPGFIDIHTHGAGGYSFSNRNSEDIINACDFHLLHGTTSILPTISSLPIDEIKSSVMNIAKAIESKKCKSNIIGAHIEGPYFSLRQCGAQYPDFITEPIKEDYESLINEFGKYIKRWSFAPERDKNGTFCKFLTQNNIIASAGHTDAIYQDMKIAINNGCNLVTHLYSCTSTVTRENGFRRLGVIETAFLEDDLFVEIIADGKHLPPELINMIIKIKGTDKVALITDSMAIAGTNSVAGVSDGTEYIVEDGVCKLKDRSAFCGSVATADKLVKVLINECGKDLITAVKMITKVPNEILKLNKGEIAKGKDADLVVFDDDINISSAFVAGVKVI